MKRSRGYFRNMRQKAIDRKKHIIVEYRRDNPPSFLNGGEIMDTLQYAESKDDYEIAIRTHKHSYGDYESYWHVKSEGHLAKGKTHCSCAMCAFHGTTMQDIRSYERMKANLEDCEEYYGKPEINSLNKKINGVWYPKGNLEGTSLGTKENFDIEEWNHEMKMRKELDQWREEMEALMEAGDEEYMETLPEPEIFKASFSISFDRKRNGNLTAFLSLN